MATVQNIPSDKTATTTSGTTTRAKTDDEINLEKTTATKSSTEKGTLPSKTDVDLIKLADPDNKVDFKTDPDGKTVKIIRGCTDVNAFNYNPNATVDDNSCVYLPPTNDSVIISVTCKPGNGIIYIDGESTKKVTPAQLKYNDKHLLTPRVITVIKPGHITLTKYRLSVKQVFVDVKTSTKVKPFELESDVTVGKTDIQKKTEKQVIKVKPLITPVKTEIERTSTDGGDLISFATQQNIRTNTTIDKTDGKQNIETGLDKSTTTTKSDVENSQIVTVVDKPAFSYYEIVLEKFIKGQWVQQPYESLVGAAEEKIAHRTIELPFEYKDFKAIPAEETIKEIQIIGDVHTDDAVFYNTSMGDESFVINDRNTVVTFKKPTTSSLVYTPWIQFNNNGEVGKQSVKYSVLKPGTKTPTILEDDFRLEVPDGITVITVISNKINLPDEPIDHPIVIVDNDQLRYNISDGDSLKIPYYSYNTDFVSYQLGKTTRDISPSGSIILTKSDFANSIGTYVLVLTPKSEDGLIGAHKRVTINVVSTEYRPGPDITHITYPENIIGASFSGYDHPFKISWQSVNTNYINIYSGNYDAGSILCKSGPQGTLTLNIKDVLKKARVVLDPDRDIIPFDLILVPVNVEGTVKTIGKQERITISFDKGNLTLLRNDVIRDIRNAFIPELDTSIFDVQTSKYLTHQIHLGDGIDKLIATWATDYETFSDYKPDPKTGNLVKVRESKSLVLKLYEPLDRTVQPDKLLWISKLQSVPIIEQITLVDEIIDSSTPLTPNFSYKLGDDIGYQVLDSLVASGSLTSTELVNEFIDRNELSLSKLNIEYISGSDYVWDNFVRFSSAVERSENFFYKIKLLEFYQNKLEILNSTTTALNAVSVINEQNRINTNIQSVKTGFDDFENTLYSVSGSLSYPGAGGSSVSASTHDDSVTWYNGIITSATSYDRNNVNSFVNNLPKHIVNDSNGQEYVLFFTMMGQHFDLLWNYTKSITESKKLVHRYDSGITNDLLYHMLGSLGLDVDSTVGSQFLWEYAFGQHKDGTEVSYMSGKRRQTEVWRRLLNNLPYLYKHKGTKRALSAAMACYGVPNSMLTIMEFGGATDPTNSTTNTVTFDERATSLIFDDAASVLIPWKSHTTTSDFPNCVELRVNTSTKSDYTLLQAESWDLKVVAGDGTLAKLVFNITGSSNPISASTDFFPFFNDEYTQIVINKTTSGSIDIFDMYAKEGFNERIRNESYAQVTSSTNNTTWKYGTELELGGGFVGTIDEFRLWTTPLSESRVENHTLMPEAIDGNHVSASTEDLIFRLDFEYPKNRASVGDVNIKNVSINTSYASYATASNFTSITDYPYQYLPTERTVTATVPSMGIGYNNKIRLGTQSLENTLTSKKTIESTEDISTYGSSRLGLFFSPMKEINMDIVKSLGSFSIDDYIGNPSDEFNDNYSELDTLRKYYFERYNLNIYEYIQLVRYIDTSLFTTLESLVPGRAKVSSGLLIEPHVLERSKIRHKPVVSEKMMYESSYDVNEDINLTSSYDVNMVTLDATPDQQVSGLVPQYNAEPIDMQQDVTLTSLVSSHTGTYVTTDDFDITSTVTQNASSDMGGMSVTIDAIMTGSLQGFEASMVQTQIGMEPNSIANSGYGIYGENGHSIRTYRDLTGNTIQERNRIYVIKEQYVVNVPVDINTSGSASSYEMVPTTRTKYSVSILPYSGSTPVVGGNIIEVTPLNGYLPSHYRYVGDLNTGLKNSYFNGSKNTIATTIDGQSPVQTFITNPNILKVSDTGRASGDPILTTI